MAAQPGSGVYDEVTQKWRDLAERRCAHFLDLQESGRWRRYYTKEQFEACMRDVVAAAEAWARIVPRPRPFAGRDPAAPAPSAALFPRGHGVVAK